jgi:hypothetical protein
MATFVSILQDDVRANGARGRFPQAGGTTQASPVLFHPDYTVGPGIQPGLLTPLRKEAGARGLMRIAQTPPVGNCTPP